jgi:hypothetical protein
MSDILQEALSAIQRGDMPLAKQLLSQAVIQDPSNDNAWMMMSKVAEDVKSKRNYLERALAINPNNVEASTALTRLDTAPLSPVTRGERDKPIYQSNFDKIPPFTPPNTWGNDQEQFLAPTDPATPELPVEQSIQSTETTPTFDWANDSEEPDRTIDQLFIAVSSPELASQPRPNSDLTWLDQNQSAMLTNTLQDMDGKSDAMWLDELVGTDVEPLPEVSIGTLDGFPINDEPAPVSEDVTPAEQPGEPIGSDYQLWDNPATKKNRMIILSDTSLIYANPKESDVPHILGLFAEKKMIRDLLGEKAGLIKLESIRRLMANPKKSDLSIVYVDSNKKKLTHKLTFLSQQVRDEVLGVMKSKPGADYRQTIQVFRIQDKIVPPLAALLLVVFLVWGLNAGLPMLSALTSSQLGILAPIVSLMMGIVLSIGRTTLFLIYVLCGLLSVVWLVSNLRKPSTLTILDR